MARFLFTVWPFPGHVHPNVAIAHALTARGHEAAFYTSESLKASIEGEGFNCFLFERVDAGRVEEIVLAVDARSLQWWKARESKALLEQWLLGTIEAQIADLQGVIARWRPDVIVCDPAMWGPLLVLHEIERIPLAVMSYVAACMLPGPQGPIVGLPLRQPRGPLGRLGRQLLRSIAHVVSKDVRRAADAVRAAHGLSPIDTSVTEYAGQMPLYLLPSTPSYDRQRSDLPRSVHYVGPCQWDKPGAAAVPAWLERMPDDRPLVYVTEGTMHSKEPLLLRAAIDGLAALPVNVIATTGSRRDPASLGLRQLPANVRVERFVPHTDLLPRVDVVVTTGGTGTVLATLANGVPLVIVPTAWDQPENAWRVAETGAGLRIAATRCTPARIRAAVGTVLKNPSFRDNARRLGAELSRYRGAEEAADLLEQLSGDRRGAAAPSAAAARTRDAVATFSGERRRGEVVPFRKDVVKAPHAGPIGTGTPPQTKQGRA
jgi:MGT family glycosyltransferase